MVASARLLPARLARIAPLPILRSPSAALDAVRP
jgi:hypothetical protein